MRVHRRLDPARDARQRLRLGRDHVDRGAHPLRRAQHRPARPAPPAPPRRPRSCSAGRARRPHQAAAPVQEPAPARFAPPRPAPPHRCDGRTDTRHTASPGSVRSGTASRIARHTALLGPSSSRDAAQLRRQPAQPVVDAAGKILDPHHRDRALPGQRRHPLRRLRRQERRRRNAVRRAQRRRQQRARPAPRRAPAAPGCPSAPAPATPSA